MLTKEESEQIGKLWHAIGAIQAYADPDGLIATRYAMTPEQRLAKVWETVQQLKP